MIDYCSIADQTQVSHLITYHRFLFVRGFLGPTTWAYCIFRRFLPSGIVLSLLRNEDSERPLKDLIHSIKLDLRMKVGIE